LSANQKLSIDLVSPDGKPLDPKQHTTKIINQCGVIVRDMIPITVQEWQEPKKARLEATFVTKDPRKTFGGSSWQISFYLRITPRGMMMVMKFRVDMKGGGKSNSTLSTRWVKHSGASRKCYTRSISRKRKLLYSKEHMRS
jgi:hypothetical protein